MPETTKKHTPTPWRASDTDAAVILADDHSDESDYPYAVAFCEPCVPLNGDGDYGQFNAARIILAVNAHDDLVAALKQCRSELEEASKLLAGNGLNGMASIYAQAAERVIAALAKAEGAPLDLSTAVEG